MRRTAVVRTGRAGLVGRSEQMATLAATFDRAVSGEMSAVAVSGEAGIGKSRLLADFSALARQRGARVLVGSGYEAEGTPPYRPLIEALRPLLTLPAAQLRRALGIAAGDLARHTRQALAEDGTWMIVGPFAGDQVEQNLNPVGRVYYAASTMICAPVSLAAGGPALGAQAGEARLREVATAGGFPRFRRAAETPFNIVLEARP